VPGARKDATPITLENPDYVGRLATLGDYTVGFETLRGVMDPAPVLKGLPDDRCPCSHWGVVMSGRITMRHRDHDEVFEAGDLLGAPQA